MPKGITFTDREEAKEYASRMEGEGTRTAIIRQDGIWKVILLGKDNPPVKGSYEGSGKITFPKKPSTRTRLHEIAHRELGHEPGREKISTFISNEIDAEIWARKKMNHKITPRVGLTAYATLLIDFGYSEDEAP